jgi:hypothetical protein
LLRISLCQRRVATLILAGFGAAFRLVSANRAINSSYFPAGKFRSPNTGYCIIFSRTKINSFHFVFRTGLTPLSQADFIRWP